MPRTQREHRSTQQPVQQPIQPTFAPTVAIPAQQQALDFAAQQTGQPLEAATRAAMEQRFQHNFADVRVYASPEATETAAELHAKAFTVGSDIVLGDLTPSSFGGQRILAHELAHVAQNERFGVNREAGLSRVDDGAERQAHTASDRAVFGSSVTLDAAPSAAISTWPDWMEEAAHTVGQFGSGVMQEGLGGLTDMSGMMDRQRAQEELADRFTVADGEIPTGSASNVVSREEYERIAHTYSDVRLGRGDLTIDTSSIDSETAQGTYGMTPEEYRQGALNDIASMMQTRSGRHEIEALHDNPLVNDAGETRNSLFGFELPQLPGNLDGGLGDPIHHHTTMVPLLNATGGMDTTNGYAAPDGDGSMRDTATGDRGSGSDVHIRYNPGVNIGDSRPGMQADNPWMESFRSDILLAHEMNHAVQQTQGTGDSTAVQASDDPSSTGVGIDAAYRDGSGNPLRRIEHQAVGIGQSSGNDMTENAYRRERREMADLGAVGLIGGRSGVDEGDAVLTERDTYVGHPSSAPAPAPAPTGTGSPAAPGAIWPPIEDHD